MNSQKTTSLDDILDKRIHNLLSKDTKMQQLFLQLKEEPRFKSYFTNLLYRLVLSVEVSDGVKSNNIAKTLILFRKDSFLKPNKYEPLKFYQSIHHELETNDILKVNIPFSVSKQLFLGNDLKAFLLNYLHSIVSRFGILSFILFAILSATLTLTSSYSIPAIVVIFLIMFSTSILLFNISLLRFIHNRILHRVEMFSVSTLSLEEEIENLEYKKVKKENDTLELDEIENDIINFIKEGFTLKYNMIDPRKIFNGSYQKQAEIIKKIYFNKKLDFFSMIAHIGIILKSTLKEPDKAKSKYSIPNRILEKYFTVFSSTPKWKKTIKIAIIQSYLNIRTIEPRSFLLFAFMTTILTGLSMLLTISVKESILIGVIIAFILGNINIVVETKDLLKLNKETPITDETVSGR